jgi:F420-non-reducing hydrogenase small subunit
VKRFMADKPKLSMYWASSCGGCEIALANLHEKLLDVDRHFDFMFCPCLLDTKKSDIEALPGRDLAITFFNGAIRTSENLEMARLLRAKSQLLVAFGSCAADGGIPALSNLHRLGDHLRTVYHDGPSVHNPSAATPCIRTAAPGGDLELPEFFAAVETLAQVVEVDYFIPGCPPEPSQLWNVVESVIRGRPLPPRGSALGCGVTSVCAECTREKNNKKIARFHRTYEIVPDTRRCLLEQGIICMGVATRDGCGALCPQVNTPCTGCYGPPEGVADQGAKMLAALGSVLDIGSYKRMAEEETAQHTDRLLAAIPDLAGTLYKYSLAGSLLRRARS